MRKRLCLYDCGTPDSVLQRAAQRNYPIFLQLRSSLRDAQNLVEFFSEAEAVAGQ